MIKCRVRKSKRFGDWYIELYVREIGQWAVVSTGRTWAGAMREITGQWPWPL